MTQPDSVSNKIVSPRDVWMRTHFYRKGHMLHAVTYIVAAQNPEVFRVSVDLRPIAAAVIRYHNRLEADYHTARASGDCIGCDDAERAEIEGCVGCSDTPTGAAVSGFFGSIGKIIKKVGKSKLLAKVAAVGKTIIKSKITGGILLGAAAVFPPVGAPALAAYAAANATIVAVEQANKVKRGIEKAVIDKAKNPKSPRALLLAKVVVNPKAQLKIQKIGTRAKAAKKFIAEQSALANYSPNPARRAEARKAVRILRMVADHREKLKATAKKSPSKGTTGLVIDGRGRITHGRFIKEQAKRGASLQLMLAAQGKAVPGYFRKISGCIGCF